MEDTHSEAISALQQFRAARLQGNLEKIQAALSGKSADLLSYEEVRSKLNAKETNLRQLKDIPLDAIAGSVGRYSDFSRRFFPLQEENENRWARVRLQAESLDGLPPIEAFQIGEAYFVIDGNHRVSVARSLGATHIEGYVTQVLSDVPLSAEINPDDLIIAERYTNFLDNTQLKQIDPQLDMRMSAAGNYRFLERQIRVHQELMKQPGTFQQAAKDWYKNVYWPVIQIIRQRGMLRDFPQRTETDLYVWIEKHRQDLITHLGWQLNTEKVAVALADEHSQAPEKKHLKAEKKLWDALTPEVLHTGPMPGEWRSQWQQTHQNESLFRHILVALNGRKDGWNAMKLALEIARRDHGSLYGLHISQRNHQQATEITRLKEKFDQYCDQANLCAGLSFQTGNISRVINQNARWMDLVVISLAHPPGSKPLDRLSSGLSQLLRRCPRLVLCVPQSAQSIDRVLLAYDHSPASQEALYVAAYLSLQWEMPLTVISVVSNPSQEGCIHYAQEYLHAKQIQADLIERAGDPAVEILQEASFRRANLVILGSYGAYPIKEIALGSTVDEVLRKFESAVLVCR